jgi:hypothetical protein
VITPDCGCLLCDASSDPSTWDSRDRRTADNVGRHGWSVTGVAGGDLPGDWSYTIGLWHSLRSPEVSVFGVPAQTGMRILNVLGDAIREGHPLEPDQRRHDVLTGYPVAIRPVHPSWYQSFFGAGLDYYQRPPLPITQMFWPDKQGRFPWDEGVHEACRTTQPLLWIPREDSSGPWADEDPKRNWPFATTLPYHEVRAAASVASGSDPVMRAERSEAGMWTFEGDPSTQGREDLVTTTLGHLVGHHPDLKSIAWLTPGQSVLRLADGAWPTGG